MLKVYKAPKSIKKPKFNLNTILKDEEMYVKKLQKWCKSNSTDINAGQIVKFPVADGCAVYMIFTLKPCKLIFVDIGDEYQYQYITKLTSKDIKAQIQKEKVLEELFS